MRDKSGVILVAVLAAFALSGFSAVVFSGACPAPDDRPTLGRSSSGSQDQPAAAGPETTREWLASMRPYCNPVDVELYATIVDAYEGTRRFTSVVAGGEPFLQKRNLYRPLGGEGHGDLQHARNWILQMSDGTHSTLEIAKRSGFPADFIDREAGVLERADLLKECDA